MLKQILDHLLAEMNVMQEKTEASLKEIKTEIRTNNEKFEVLQDALVARINIHQSRTQTKRETRAKMDAWTEKTEVCVGKLEANREKSDTVAEHQEVPNEEAEVKTVGDRRGRYEDQHLVVGCCHSCTTQGPES
jgi:hypothetical protein